MVLFAAGATALVVFLALDGVWLALVAAPLFQREVGGLLRPAPDLTAAGLFYLLYGAAMLGLVIRPALREARAGAALAQGALFGLAAYGTFELTSMAVLKGWTWNLVLADMAWGAIGTPLACLAGYAMGRRTERIRAAKAPATAPDRAEDAASRP